MTAEVSASNSAGVVVGIDATNLRQGGGRTHLVEILRALDPIAHGVERVVVWGSRDVLEGLDERPWLAKISPPFLNASLVFRSLWQRFSLSTSARAAGCNVLFVPGGSFAGDFRPVVTMSQNLLPFEWKELRRYGVSLKTLRLMLLRLIQTRSFRTADGVIFLTRYAIDTVLQVTGPVRGHFKTVPHGIGMRFFRPPRVQKPVAAYSPGDPYKLLYVSIVDQYKHQWHVVEAVARLRRSTGLPITLDLVGPAYRPAMRRLEAALRRYDPANQWANYRGSLPYQELHKIYAEADLGIFASSCENLPIILLETMAAGLPIASSSCGPMPEVLGNSGLYFNPERPDEIANTLNTLIFSESLRTELSRRAAELAAEFTWGRCSALTFDFLVDVHRRYRLQGSSCVA